MDKSESEILEEWDIVSSVYDTEQENDRTEKNGVNVEASANGNETTAEENGTSTNNITGTSDVDASIEFSEIDSKENVNADVTKADTEISCQETASQEDYTEEMTDNAAEEIVDTDTNEIVETVSEEIIADDMREILQANSQEAIEADTGETIKAVTEKTNEIDTQDFAEGDVEDGTDADVEETADADTEETSETEEITVIETVMYDVKKISDIDTERAKTYAEKITHDDFENSNYENIEKTNSPDNKSSEDIGVQENNVPGDEKNIDVETICNTETNIDAETICNAKANVVGNICNTETNADVICNTETNVEQKIDAVAIDTAIDNHEDRIVNSSLDSSMEHIQLEQCEGSCIQNLPELIPKLDLTEQENAAIESSSSDIDIIDENMEESVTRSFVHPLSLSISSAVDTSNILSSTSEEDKSIKTEDEHSKKSESHPERLDTLPKTSEVYAEKLESYSKASVSCTTESESLPRPSPPRQFPPMPSLPRQSDYEYQRHSHEERSEYARRPESQRSHPQARSSFIGFIFHSLRNLTPCEWSIIGSLVIALYFTIIFNNINIFAVLERDDVVFQMKKMIDDLRYDNKILKDQMLSEMKNDKVLSSFEHQLRELRKENSRLNHMLYDVAKVLEKQKDSHERFEKKEAEYLAPFKKEINKLKEHINILKFDNEELQKQLVRMRYSSYSQGGKDTSDEKDKEQKQEVKADEIPLDINSLKKWNELISLLSKELGLLSENDPLTKEKYESKNISWYWKFFLKEFKGTFDEFKANITSRFIDYKKVQENTVSDIYKSIKNFFTVEEQNKQTFIPPGEESSQWKNIGDFFSDLKDKWTKIKNRIDTSDLQNIFKDFKMPGNAETSQEYNSEKSKSSPYEYNEKKPTNVHFETDRKPTSGHFETDRKPTSGHFESERKPTNIHFESSRKPSNVHFESDKRHDKVQSDSEDTKWMFERAALRAELRGTEKEDESVNWFLKKNKHLSKDDAEKNKY